MEGKLVYQAMRRLAEHDGHDAALIEQLLFNIDGLERFFDGLGFCLSNEGDLLSQWRGYASDGCGLAIGFSKDYLEWLSEERDKSKGDALFRLEKVIYDFSEHDTHVRPTYEKVIAAIKSGAFNIIGPKALNVYFDPKELAMSSYGLEEEVIEDPQNQKAFSEFLVSAITLLPVLFTLKSPAFREESEWRLISTNTRTSNPRPLYRSTHDRMVPFHECKLLALEKNPIREVVLGPKHNTPINVVEQFLDDNGFKNIRVYKSEASYR